MKWIIFSFFFSFAAQAGTCDLERPIPVGDFLKKDFMLHDVVVDETPRFTDPQKFNVGRDSLDMQLFNIFLNKHYIGAAGTLLQVHRTGEGVGFANQYSGNYHFDHSILEENGAKTYFTKNVMRLAAPDHTEKDAITSATVRISEGAITSIVFTFPVLKIENRVSGTQRVSFTGEHQTLCVKSAR